MQNQFLAGQHFGPYLIESHIGTGGMGQILRVRKGPKTYALKFLHANDPDAIERFRREAEALVKTEKLPYFARVHAFGMSPLPHLVMEYIDAPNLDSCCKAHPLPEPDALALAKKLATGLKAFHQQGLVHRDFKPRNILIREAHTGDIEPIIIDFGLVTGEAFETLTQTREILGTPIAMAPEQWQGGPNSKQPAVDIWALGVTYYFLLTGRYPFTGTPLQIFSQTQAIDWQKLSENLSEKSIYILKSCLQTNPEARVKDPVALLNRVTVANQKQSRTLKLSILIGLIVTATAFLAVTQYQQSQHNQQVIKNRQLAKEINSLQFKLPLIIEAYCATKILGTHDNPTPELLELEAQVTTTCQSIKAALNSQTNHPSAHHKVHSLLESTDLLLKQLNAQPQSNPSPQTIQSALTRTLAFVPGNNQETINSEVYFLNSFKERNYDFCHTLLKNDQLFKLTKTRARIQRLLQLKHILKAFQPDAASTPINPDLFKALATDKQLLQLFSAELKRIVAESPSKTQQQQFEFLVCTLIQHQFGVRCPWPTLNQTRQLQFISSLNKKLIYSPTNSTQRRSNLLNTARLIFCLSQYLRTEHKLPKDSPLPQNLTKFILTTQDPALPKHIQSHILTALILGIQTQFIHPTLVRNGFDSILKHSFDTKFCQSFSTQWKHSDFHADLLLCLLLNSKLGTTGDDPSTFAVDKREALFKVITLDSQRLPKHLQAYHFYLVGCYFAELNLSHPEMQELLQAFCHSHPNLANKNQHNLARNCLEHSLKLNYLLPHQIHRKLTKLDLRIGKLNTGLKDVKRWRNSFQSFKVNKPIQDTPLAERLLPRFTDFNQEERDIDNAHLLLLLNTNTPENNEKAKALVLRRAREQHRVDIELSLLTRLKRALGRHFYWEELDYHITKPADKRLAKKFFDRGAKPPK